MHNASNSRCTKQRHHTHSRTTSTANGTTATVRSQTLTVCTSCYKAYRSKTRAKTYVPKNDPCDLLLYFPLFFVSSFSFAKPREDELQTRVRQAPASSLSLFFFYVHGCVELCTIKHTTGSQYKKMPKYVAHTILRKERYLFYCHYGVKPLTYGSIIQDQIIATQLCNT